MSTYLDSMICNAASLATMKVRGSGKDSSVVDNRSAGKCSGDVRFEMQNIGKQNKKKGNKDQEMLDDDCGRLIDKI